MENKKFANIYLSQSNKNVQKRNINQRASNKSYNKYKTINEYNEKSLKSYNEINFNKLLISYHNFVNENFGNYEFIPNKNFINKEHEVLTKKMKEKQIFTITNIKIKVKEPEKEFNAFLNEIPSHSFDDNIISEIPNIPEFCCKENKLGKHKNNIEDYLIRKNKNIETININTYLTPDEPFEEINDEDINNELDLNIEENEIPNQPIINDQEAINRLDKIVNENGDKLDNIVECWRKNRKKIKLFVGFENDTDNIFYRIYGKGLDKNGKIKSIEYHRYWIRHGEDWIEMNLEKSIKELYDVDSMKIDDLLERINDVINKFQI